MARVARWVNAGAGSVRLMGKDRRGPPRATRSVMIGSAG